VVTAVDLNLVKSFNPGRDDSAHKNNFGQLLVTAGSEFMTGALVLSVTSALRSGTGLVKAFTSNEALAPLRISCPCALTAAFDSDISYNLRLAGEFLSSSSAALIGPGIDEEDGRYKALTEFYAGQAPALVMDAGALNITSKEREIILPLLKTRVEKGLGRVVLTPHVGEMRRLLRGDVTESACEEFARDNDVVLVLKDAVTRVFTPEGDIYEYEGRNSGMAKGGSGDVLAGLIAGFLAQGIDPVKAAVSGVYFHGQAGRALGEDKGKRAMLPSDLTDYFTKTFDEAGW